MSVVVVERCRVRVVNRCPWVVIDRVAAARAVSRLVAEQLVAGLLDRSERRAVRLDRASLHVQLRCDGADLMALAGDGPPSAVLVHRLVDALDSAVAGLGVAVELVDVDADTGPDGQQAEVVAALWLGPVTAPSVVRRPQGPTAFGSLHPLVSARLAAGPVARASASTIADGEVAHPPGPAGPRRRSAPDRSAAPPAPPPARSPDSPPPGTVVDDFVPSDATPLQTAPAVPPVGVDPADASHRPRSDYGPDQRTTDRRPATRTGGSHDDRRWGTRGEATVRSVLPYLVLGSLSQHGLLDELADRLEGEGWGDLLADPVAALTRKVLGPPPPGSPDRSDLVVAGLTDPPDGGRLEFLARRASSWLWPVTVSAAELLFVDRPPAGTVLVVADGTAAGGVVMAEADGLFPVTWGGDRSEAAWWWRRAGEPPVLGTWPPFDDRPYGAAEADGGEAGDDPVGRLSEVHRRLARRPAAAWADLPELEAGLAALAAFGLADVAHRVFQPLGPTDPGQALTHFADLDGVVHFHQDRVVVTMPVGRRHGDLRDAGLLATIPEVPWLGGRPVELVGG